jgi:hypothetical protein
MYYLGKIYILDGIVFLLELKYKFMDIIYNMAFSSMSTIHSMIHFNKKNVSGGPFSGSVQLLSMAGQDSRSISSSWMSINGTGNYLIAVSYYDSARQSAPYSVNYLSSNAGANWTKINSTPIVDGLNLRQAWISRDGVYRIHAINSPQYFTGGIVYSSSDSGSTYGNGTAIRELQGAFVSDDGNVKIVSANDTSGNAPDTTYFWKINNKSINTFTRSNRTGMAVTTSRGIIKGSSDGKYLMSYTGNIGMQFSTNYGASWYSLAGVTGLTGSTGSNMADMAISGDGQYMIIAGTGYKLWKTSNYGTNWTTITASNTLVNGLPNTSTYTSTTNTWAACSASKTGQYMSVAGYFNQGGTFGTNAYVFVSSDYGSNWISKQIPLNSTIIDPGLLTSTMSYNDAGVPNKIFTATYGEGIYYINF